VIRSLLVALVMLVGANAHAAGAADDAHSLFAHANERYFAGDYAEAAKAYGEIVTRYQIEDPALYHNLGNAYFRSGAYGSAILYYQRALRLDPPAQLAEALDANLGAARRTLQTRYRQSSDEALVYADPSGVLYHVSHVMARTPLAIVFAALWTAFFVLLMLRRVRSGARWPGRAAVPVGIAAALAGLLVWSQIATDADHRIGVVISDGAKLREGAHESAQGKDLPEGIEVKILEGDESWTQVELSNGNKGWIEAAKIKQI